MKVKKQVVIIQNVDIGSTKALSTFMPNHTGRMRFLLKFSLGNIYLKGDISIR